MVFRPVHGVTPRKHGNLEKKPSHSQQYNDIKLVVQFISSYALGYHNQLPQEEEMTLLLYTFHPMQGRPREMLKAVRTTDKCGIPHFATSGTSVFRILYQGTMQVPLVKNFEKVC